MSVQVNSVPPEKSERQFEAGDVVRGPNSGAYYVLVRCTAGQWVTLLLPDGDGFGVPRGHTIRNVHAFDYVGKLTGITVTGGQP